MGLFQNLTGWHALILLAVVLLIFGATRLPALARSLGQSMTIFRSEVRDGSAAASTAATSSTEDEAGGSTTASSAQSPAAPVATVPFAVAPTASAPLQREASSLS
ncbi:twin-arginine translocase TatA/TatE family subunit [Herbiconiux liukaitaii]|uniref:twin-arginine translocase TatA/TatE family subunit n=1 Tax=Herbiconiux liukaitaii TaxID=3342799 RepID=UPI0035B6C25B